MGSICRYPGTMTFTGRWWWLLVERGAPMNSAEPVLPLVPRAREVKASVLAAFQLVEDARYLGSERRTRQLRARVRAERTVAYRRLARDLRAAS
jgi:hypothetical protein